MVSSNQIQSAQRAFNIFKEYGFSDESALGITGNLHYETGGTWSPTMVESGGGGGYGLAQWTPRSNLYNQASQLGYTQSQADTFDIQCRIIAQGDVVGQWANASSSDYGIPLNQSPMTFNQYKQLSNIDVATVNFMTHYERPTYDPIGNAWRTRVQLSNDYAQHITGGGTGGQTPFFPTTEGLPITSGYGWRDHPITGEPDFHSAIDISGQGVNHPIYATQSGKVVENRFSDSGGWLIGLEHTGDPYYSLYMHLAERAFFSVGQTVERGEQIGIMGTTGLSTGIHLHFAIGTVAGGYYTEEGSIDPLLYLDMEFGGGGLPPSSQTNKLITLWLSDALNGWQW